LRPRADLLAPYIRVAPENECDGGDDDRRARDGKRAERLVDHSPPEEEGDHRVDVGVGGRRRDRGVLQQPDEGGVGEDRARHDEVHESEHAFCGDLVDVDPLADREARSDCHGAGEQHLHCRRQQRVVG
jgi:hypothetical protein